MDGVRKLIIPKPLDIGGQPFPLKAFVMGLMNGDRFNRDWEGLSAGHRICEALETANGTVRLGSKDWEKLAEEAKSPSKGYPVSPAIGAYPFVQAILDATEDGD